MQRDSLAAIGQSLRQDLDAFLQDAFTSDDLTVIRALVEDTERLSSALAGDVESFATWMSSATIDLAISDEHSTTEVYADSPRKRAGSAEPEQDSLPSPLQAAHSEAVEQTTPQAALFARESTRTDADEFDMRQDPPDGISRLSNDAPPSVPSAPGRAPLMPSPAARTGATHPTPAGAEARSKSPPDTQRGSPATRGGFSTVKSLSDLARRIGPEVRLTDLPSDETTTTALSRGSAPGMLPKTAQGAMITDRSADGLAPSVEGRTIPPQASREWIEGSLREDLARLIGARPPTPGAGPSSETLPQSPQRVELFRRPDRDDVETSERRVTTKFEVGAPPRQEMAVESRTVDDQMAEVDMDSLLEALARNLREDYKRYYGI